VPEAALSFVYIVSFDVHDPNLVGFVPIKEEETEDQIGTIK